MDSAVPPIDRDIVKGILFALHDGQQTVTYDDLARIIQAFSGRNINAHVGFNIPLGRIQNHCAECDLPCLSSVVVDQSGVPGSEFVDYYRKTNPNSELTDDEILRTERQACKAETDWTPLLNRCDIDPSSLWKGGNELPVSDNVDWNALASLLDRYEESLAENRGDELYKWEAARCFQEHWDIDAPDLKAMLEMSLAETKNLLTSGMYYASGMLIGLAENDPDAVRSSFRSLFDEAMPLANRMEAFSQEMNHQLAALNETRTHNGIHPAKNHYQDVHAISVYLSLRKDTPHFIYKDSVLRSFAALVGANTPTGKYDRVLSYEDLCQEVLSYIFLARPDLISKSDALLDESLQAADSNHHMLAQDIAFFASNGIARNWVYAPGEQAKFWAEFRDLGIMGIGWDDLGDPSQFKTKGDLKEALIEVFGTKNPRNDADSIWAFVKDIKPGDIIWARKGHGHVVGRGIVVSDFEYDAEREHYRSIRRVEWTEFEEAQVEGKFSQRTLYELTEKTAVKASALEQLPLTAKEHSDSRQLQPPERKHYWWLNANPRIWSLADMEPGEECFYTLINENGRPRRIRSNFLAAKTGDLVVGYESAPEKKVVALCEISRDTDKKNLYFRKVQDLPPTLSYSDITNDNVLKSCQFAQNPNGSLFSLTEEEFLRVMELTDVNRPLPLQPPAEAYTDENFLNDVYVDESELFQMKRLLSRKKNLILQGAPGTGKTFCAKRLAWAYMGEKDENRICMVQFHQNTTYDDMMAGYRPTEDAGFKVVPGEFLRFCDKAAHDPEDKPWFFIIDEINRANISKVFGELLMLIEPSHRGETLKLSLLGHDVCVPPNLYIIGMMNTADRSLALIDYALRRRFAFYDMNPAFGNARFRRYLDETGCKALSSIVETVARLNAEIADDPSFGPGFRIGHSYFCLGDSVTREEVADVIDFELAPLIREYWFDAPNAAETKIATLESAIQHG